MPVVDTEFLFALRGTDRKHSVVREILQELEGKRVASTRPMIIPMAVLELVTVLLSEGKDVKEIHRVLELIDEITQGYGLGFAEFSLNQMVQGLSIYESSRIGLFDSIMAGAAIDLGTEIVSDDTDFDIRGLKRLTFREYLATLRKHPTTTSG
jgi:predicted nucleic acid-binding protein